MLSLSTLHDLDDVAVWFVAAAVLVFLSVYTKGLRFYAWLHNPIGRTIVWLDLCVLLAVIPACIRTITGPAAFWDSRLWVMISVANLWLAGIIFTFRIFTWSKLFWWTPRPRGRWDRDWTEDQLSQDTTSEYPNTPTP